MRQKNGWVLIWDIDHSKHNDLFLEGGIKYCVP